MIRAGMLAAVLFCAGCAGIGTAPKRDGTAALVTRPDFPAAAKAAPEWVRAALHQITALEAELEAKP